VRVRHGTTYIGTAKGGEGATLVVYSDHHAAEKNGGRPNCHVELRLLGSRTVRAAVGSGLDLNRAWRRVRLVDDLSRVPGPIKRAAQNLGPAPYAQDLVDVMRRWDLDSRMLGRGRPLSPESCTAADSRDDAAKSRAGAQSKRGTPGLQPAPALTACVGQDPPTPHAPAPPNP
jgi:hypothetical protein